MKKFILFFALSLLACGDSSKKAASKVAPNNGATNNTDTNNGSNNGTNNVTNGSTNNSEIPDSLLVKDVTEAQEAKLLEEFRGKLTPSDLATVCVVEGYYEAMSVDETEMVEACTTREADCLVTPRYSNPIYRSDDCLATVGDLRACKQADVDRLSDIGGNFVECPDLTASNLEAMLETLANLEQTDACARYFALCP